MKIRGKDVMLEWVYRSRLRRFVCFSLLFGLIASLVQIAYSWIGQVHPDHLLPVMIGVAMGITYALWIPRNIEMRLKRLP